MSNNTNYLNQETLVEVKKRKQKKRKSKKKKGTA